MSGKLTALMALALVVLRAASLWAQGDVIDETLPAHIKLARHGLMLRVTSDWSEGPGYRPIHIKATPTAPGPLPADRTLRLEFISPGDYRSNFTTVGYLELSEGSAGGSLTLLVPNSERIRGNWMLQVYEDGVRLPELCTSGYLSNNNDGALRTLFITNSGALTHDSAAARLFQIMPLPEDDPDVRASGRVRVLNQQDRLTLSATANLPQNWLAYTCLDVVAIAWPDLAQLAQSEPERFDALRRWTHAGGSLFVYQLGGNAAATAGGERAAPKLAPTGVVSNLAQLDREYDASRTMETRRYGLGRVILLGDTLEYQPHPQVRGALRMAFADLDYAAENRFGIDEGRSESSFFSFLIPGVGQAPVGAFVTLISVFALVVGPVNYGLLRRYRRLHFFPLTVAGSAFLVTAGLIGYALVCDGLGVRARVRSYTLLDQPAGLAASYSRQAYYAGLAPSGGMQFPESAAVFPLALRDDRTRRSHELEWLDGQQQLRKGYFTSRTTTQFMVLSSAPSELALRVTLSESNGPPTVLNDLGGTIVKLSLCDAAGKYYVSHSIPEGESRLLDVGGGSTLSQDVSSHIAEEALEPASFAAWDSGYSYRSYRYDDDGSDFDYDRVSRNQMERRFAELAKPTCKLAPGSYVAIVERSPAVPLGYARAREQNSFHVIEGRW